MAKPVPAGSDVSAGTWACTNCGYELEVESTRHLPPCPSCGHSRWNPAGDESVGDPSAER